LRGPNLDSFGPRFIPLSDAYDLDLRRAAHSAWKELSKDDPKKMKMHEGVYAFVGGPKHVFLPTYKQSEIIVARHCGIRVLAMSLVTNAAVMDPGPRGDDPKLMGASESELEVVLGKGKADHGEVLETSRDAAEEITVGAYS
jgi:purine-nucleoside phosphorylase